MKKGRPKLTEHDSRHNRLMLSLTDDELSLLNKRASENNLRTSIYTRQAALNRLPRIVTELNQKHWIELSKSAANLNQIARRLNEMRYSNQANIDIAEIQRALLNFRCALINK